MSFTDWLLADIRLPKGIHGSPEPEHAWWNVMCLTGVDYFSTLGYPPGIAFLAAGLLSPVATLVVVLVTLFGALPVTGGWRRQARMCRAASGCWRSFSLKWGGKSLVLILLGFATTDFVITMTLPAADAAAHFVQNPFTPVWMKSQMIVTLALLASWEEFSSRGLKEALKYSCLRSSIQESSEPGPVPTPPGWARPR